MDSPQKNLQGKEGGFMGGSVNCTCARTCPQPLISVLPLLAPLSSEPALPQSGLSGCGGGCLSAPKTQTCKPSAVNSAKSFFVWPQPLPVPARTGMVKPPWGGGALQSLCSITWQGSIAKRGGDVEGQEELLWPQGSSTRCSPGLQHQHPMAVRVLVSPWADQPFFSENIHFVFPAAQPPAIPGCPLPGAEEADMSQGRGTQDALWIWELSLNSKETLIYALSPRKYFFKRHCSYLRCSYTTESHKWWFASRRVDWKFS